MFVNADDKGFVDTTDDIINALEKNDSEYDKNVSLELIQNTYKNALVELTDRGLIYEFRDNHNNKVHLIRHWFYHNKLIRGLWTNYRTFMDMVYLENNEYIIGKKPLKENNINQNKINQTKLNQYKLTETEEENMVDEKGDDYLPFDI